MKQRSLIVYGALLGGLFGLPLAALVYAGQQFMGMPFVPFDLFEWFTRVLPGGVITAGIDAMAGAINTLNLGPIDTVAKFVEQGMALVLFVVVMAVLGAIVGRLVGRARSPAWETGAGVGIAAFLLLLVLEAARINLAATPFIGLGMAVLIIAWGAAVGGLLGMARDAVMHSGDAAPPKPNGAERRALLLKATGGALALAAAAWGTGHALQVRDTLVGAGKALRNLHPASGSAPLPADPTAQRAEINPAPGTRSEITPNDQFYRIDIDLRPPRLDGQTWQLQVSGLFDRPRPLTLDDFMRYPSVTVPITQSCISNPVGGDLISATYYTGVRMRDVLQDLGMQAHAQALAVKAADGFYESISMQDMLDPRTLFVYGMNGTTLPIEHGYPLRTFIPNRYGMKQPKWITSIEAIDHPGAGYWVDRGWSQEARPQIVSIIDTVAQNNVADGKVPVGGIAWAGDRGIQKVEVQVDDGPWNEAQLLIPPRSPLIWVLWRYDWPQQQGRHTFRVRATDGTGALQVATPGDPHPNGATGYHEVTASL
jgi:DMSO/TMAO reductase YedYZ molybdopterin-dependent catalytic subunit